MTTIPPDSSIDWRTDEAVLTPTPGPAPVQLPGDWTGWQAITETGRRQQLAHLHDMARWLTTAQETIRQFDGESPVTDTWLEATRWAIAYIEAH